MRTLNTTLLSLLLGLSAALAGCSDYSLRSIPTSVDPPTIARVSPPNGGGNGGSTGGQNGPSPWDNLSPAELPEEYFALAWNDPRFGCHDCFTPVYDRPRYDIVDVQGRIVVSFDLPWSSYVEHLSMNPAGPAEFLAVSRVSLPTGERPWKAWFGDGTTGEVSVAMEWGWNGDVYLPQADRLIHLPEWLGDAHVMPDPANEDRLYVLPQNTNQYANPLLGTLYSIDLFDPEAPVVTWSPEDMVGPELIPEWGWAPWAPWHTEAYFDGEKPVIVLGLEVFDEEGEYRRILKSFSPQLGPLGWEMDLTEVTQHREVVFQPPRGERPASVLFHTIEPSWCQPADFTRFNGAELTSVDGSPGMTCTRLGPVLDDEGRTFLYYGTQLEAGVPATSSQQLMISHDGMDVWQYSRFQDGFNSIPFEIHDLVRLVGPSE